MTEERVEKKRRLNPEITPSPEIKNEPYTCVQYEDFGFDDKTKQRKTRGTLFPTCRLTSELEGGNFVGTKYASKHECNQNCGVLPSELQSKIGEFLPSSTQIPMRNIKTRELGISPHFEHTAKTLQNARSAKLYARSIDFNDEIDANEAIEKLKVALKQPGAWISIPDIMKIIANAYSTQGFKLFSKKLFINAVNLLLPYLDAYENKQGLITSACNFLYAMILYKKDCENAFDYLNGKFSFVIDRKYPFTISGGETESATRLLEAILSSCILSERHYQYWAPILSILFQKIFKSDDITSKYTIIKRLLNPFAMYPAILHQNIRKSLFTLWLQDKLFAGDDYFDSDNINKLLVEFFVRSFAKDEKYRTVSDDIEKLIEKYGGTNNLEEIISFEKQHHPEYAEIYDKFNLALAKYIEESIDFENDEEI